MEGGHLIDMVAPAFLLCTAPPFPVPAELLWKKARRSDNWRRMFCFGRWLSWYRIVSERLSGFRLGASAHSRCFAEDAWPTPWSAGSLSARLKEDGRPMFSPVLIAGAAVFIIVSIDLALLPRRCRVCAPLRSCGKLAAIH